MFQLLALWIAGIVGWAMNIIHIIGLIDSPITAKLVIMCVGVFAFPLGAILGYVF